VNCRVNATSVVTLTGTLVLERQLLVHWLRFSFVSAELWATGCKTRRWTRGRRSLRWTKGEGRGRKRRRRSVMTTKRYRSTMTTEMTRMTTSMPY
jgi:hypothetical protein